MHHYSYLSHDTQFPKHFLPCTFTLTGPVIYHNTYCNNHSQVPFKNSPTEVNYKFFTAFPVNFHTFHKKTTLSLPSTDPGMNSTEMTRETKGEIPANTACSLPSLTTHGNDPDTLRFKDKVNWSFSEQLPLMEKRQVRTFQSIKA